MNDLQIRLTFIIVFLASILIGSWYAVSFKVFGLDEREKIIDDIDKIIEQLDEMMRDNINGTKSDKQEHHYYHHNFTLTVKPALPKVCGLIQLDNGLYIGAQKMRCYTT